MAVAEKTQPATPSGSKYVDFDEFIEYQLRKTRNGIHQTDLLVAGIVLTCLVLGYLLVFTLFDHWVITGGFSWVARVCLLAGLVSTVIGLGVWKLLLPYLRHINTLYAAREIERAHPELKNSLVSLVDLRRIGREVSPSILKALEKRAATEMSHADLEQAVDRRTLMRSAYVLLAIVVLMGAYTLISPKKLSTSIWRALFPTSSVAVSTTTEILQVSPGNTEVLARSQLDVTADLAGKIPEEVTLVFSTADRRFVDETIVMRNTGEDLPRYRARLTGDQGAGLLSDVAYRIVAGDAESPTYQITVNQPPTAAVSEVLYEYPEYMLLDQKTSSSANIDAWEGTWVTVRAKANMPVTKAMIKTSDTEDISLEAEEYAMQVDGMELTCRWQLKFRREDGTFADYYHIQLWNEKEENDPQPTVNRIKIRPDQKPEIHLIHPVSDIEAPANAVVPIVFEARDPDFMLRRVDLKLERDGEVLGTSPRLMQAPPYVSELNQTYRLKLEDYLLKPGDQITFFVEAHDNRALIDGFGDDMTRTSKITISVIEPQEPEQVKEFEAEQEREAQQRLLEEDPERNERQQRPQQEKQPDQQQPQDGEMGEDGNAGEAAATEDGQPGNQGAQETNDPNAADGQTTKQSAGQGNQQPKDGTNNSDPPSEDGANEGTESGKNSQASEDGQPGQQNQPSGTENGSQQKRDKAAEDQALRELLEWNKRQQEKEKNQQPNPESPEPDSDDQDQADPSNPQQKQTPSDNSNSDSNASPNDSKASDQKSDPGQTMPEDGTSSNSNMSEDSQDGETSSSSDSTNTDSNASQSDANKPEKANDPSQNNPDKNASDGSPSGKGQESDSMDDKSTEQAQPGEVGPDAKSESGDTPASENMKEGTGEGEKTRQAADPNTQPGERTEKGDPSPNAKPTQKSNDDKSNADNQEATSSNQSDQKTNDSKMKGNDSSSDSKQPNSTDSKSSSNDSQPSPDKNSNSSRSKGEPDSQASDSSDQKSPQSDGQQSDNPPSSDTQNQNSKSSDDSGSDSKSADSQSKSNDSPRSDAANNSQDNSMSQDGKSADGQQSDSQGKGSQNGKSDQPDKQSDQQSTDSQPKEQDGNDNKQNDGNEKQSENPKGGGQQKGNQSGKQSSGSPSNQPGQDPSGQGSNAPTSQDSPMGGGTGRAEGDAAGTGTGDGVGPEAESADLESKKKATSLALKRLQEQLERGDTPQDLMDDLGYNEQDLEKFMKRLEQRLSETAATPESEAARRQFESLLKGIDYESRGDVRRGNNSGEAAQGFGSASRPVPPEFRLEQEAYKRKLSRQSANNK